MAERCPHCGLTVIGPVPVHIAFSLTCAAAQMGHAVFDPSDSEAPEESTP